jgi:hypothetical protein
VKLNPSHIARINELMTAVAEAKDRMRNSSTITEMSDAHDYVMGNKSLLIQYIEELVAYTI